jgi:UDP-MurNAc hydroxylase
MKITALGHAGLKVETLAGATILCDPWFCPEGCFQGGWFQFPDNSHLLSDPALLRPHAVLISHEHLDHVDPWFLARLPADVPVYIPRYPSPVLKEKILRGGPRRIIEADQWEEVEVAPGVFAFFVSEPPQNHDSAMVIRADGRALLNMNDARLFPVQLREIRQKVGGHVDVFAFQGAGASWYPMVYGYDEARAAELSRQKRLSKYAYCQKVMKVVEPTIGVPFAGPPAFLDPDLFACNAEQEGDGIFPDQQQVADWLAGRGVANTVVLLPGDAWDAEGGGRAADPHWNGFSFADRREYLRDYAVRRRPHLDAVLARFPEPEASLEEPFRAYMEDLLSMSPYFNRRINMRVGFGVRGPGGGDWAVDFRPGREGVYHGLEGCGYRYSFESRWLPSIIDGSIPWEDFFLSLRFQARRDPDLYNDHLLGLFKFADRQALQAVENFETTLDGDERITIHSEGKVYSVSRYCPHAGNDLLHTGEVLAGGILRCLAHHYEFDLRSGKCLTASCSPLKTELLGMDSGPP